MPESVHEVTFMADVESWINSILEKRQDLPFTHAQIEKSAIGKRTRRDLTLYDRDGNKALTGEAKMPDARDGVSPYAEAVVQDAYKKASDVGARYFFTWNVNRFVLWDPGKATLPTLQRHSWDRELFRLTSSAEVESPAVITKLRSEFLPELLDHLAALYRGETVLGVLPPDRRFIQMLENFLERPALLAEFEVFRRYKSNPAFRKEFDRWMHSQGWTIPVNESELSDTLQRAAKLCCYVLSNKLIFYEALRRRFPLKPLKVLRTVETVDQMDGLLRKYFELAQKATKDYETLFWPDYGAKVPLLAPGAIDAWREVIDQISRFNLSAIDYDVLGPIFERLIDPEAKHRWGQHYTQPNIVDVINAFTIRKADAVVMDPACGSGTFLVRAYARKRWLNPTLEHPILLSQLYGTDISGYAVHLSALGLASRELVEADNYPRVDRKDFFDISPESKFMRIPHLIGTMTTSGLGSKQTQVVIPRIDAGVGNPPYIQQEDIPKARKRHYQTVARKDAPGFAFSGRSDIYVYFWPHLTSFLNADGYLGLLTSSSWLDADYGFRLQRWLLENFRIISILESIREPWFVGARVVTAVTIVQPCIVESERMQNLVRFVQLRVPLAKLLENDGTEDGRQRAAERLRDLVLSTDEDTLTPEHRILVRSQQQLWEEGCRVRAVADSEDEEPESETPKHQDEGLSSTIEWKHSDAYRGGKWGRYLRAPDLFFEMMEKYGEAFVQLGEIAVVRRGITSGCDDFFYPQDITSEALSNEPEGRKFKERYGVTRSRVEAGQVKIVKAGDGSVWPIESQFLQPEVHSSMQIKSVAIDQAKLPDRILLVNKERTRLGGTLLQKYLEYGETNRFGGDYTVPERPTCAVRKLWYDLTGGTRGEGFWSKGQKYRHIVAWNKDLLFCNCRVYDVVPHGDISGSLFSVKAHFVRTTGRELHRWTEWVL